MKTEVRARLGGAVALLSGVAFLTEGLLYLTGQEPLQPIARGIAYPLAGAALVGFNAVQRHAYGVTGRIGSFVVPFGWASAFVGLASGVEAVHGIGFLVALVGHLFYGIGTLRARVLPSWYGVVLVAVAPLSLVAGGYTTITLGLLWIALGVGVCTRITRRSASTRAVLA